MPRNHCTTPMNSTLISSASIVSKSFSTALSVEKYTKSSTYKPRTSGDVVDGLSGAPGLWIHPKYTQGSSGLGLSPMERRIRLILVNQWRGLRRSPYRVFFRSQYLFLAADGSPDGGRTIVISSSGSSLWQNAFLQSPCFRVHPYSTAIMTRKHRELYRRTGA